MDVDLNQQPAEGEVLVFTMGGAFVVKGTVRDIAAKFGSEEWPQFELAETGDPVILRSSQVVGLRGGTKRQRGHIGFVHRSDES